MYSSKSIGMRSIIIEHSKDQTVRPKQEPIPSIEDAAAETPRLKRKGEPKSIGAAIRYMIIGDRVIRIANPKSRRATIRSFMLLQRLT
jgi:hypothetical protein